MSKLYEITISGEQIYGQQLAVNSQNKVVFEGRDGKIYVVEPDEIKPVIPYTVGVKFVGYVSDPEKATVYHYKTVVGSVFEGDIYFSTDNNQFMRVVELDTKSEKATKTIDPQQLPLIYRKPQ